MRVDRRSLLASAAATAALAGFGFSASALARQGLKLATPHPFSFEALKAQATEMAVTPYIVPPSPSPAILAKIGYDEHGEIRFKPDLSLFADGPGFHPVTFFHLGRFFQKPVRMNVVRAGEACEIIYEADYFNMPTDSPARGLTENAGFAGFRLQESRLGDQSKLDWRKNDWVAFLGASYFRAIGGLYQYGLSARGLAINVATAGIPEEFPDFTHIYFETPRPGDEAVTVCALLDGPSVAGAYRFVMTRGEGVVMDVEAALHLRKDVSRFGLAPLTSMFWYGEAAKPTAVDWRPEVHDSDGLAIWTGAGERLWRPLNNPPRTAASAFVDADPRGFGLLQRDRDIDNYQDGVHYERRPSLWVEPLDPWGAGAIELVEIPTDDEIHDNVVALWVPADKARAGSSYTLRYRLHWLADEPYPSPLGRCVATRIGAGGAPGRPRPRGVRKFIVEFLGGPLRELPYGVKPEVVLSASRGDFSYVFAEAVPNGVPGHWRAQFDLSAAGDDPVDVRCHLRAGGEVLTETWLYKHYPF